MKLATAGGSGTAEPPTEVGGALVWTPRFEGLDRKAHAAVVDEFRNRHRDRRYALVSCSVSDDGVSVIASVASALTSLVKAPDLMKQLGLRGGGRPDFAQGGGVDAAGVDDLRRRAGEALRALLEAVPHA
jgi:alanyl-tRNA synthetase